MKIGLAFTFKADYEGANEYPADIAVDFDDAETVAAVQGALESLGHEVARLPYGEDILQRLLAFDGDIIFNLCEGWRGSWRESEVPTMLEMIGTPYTGSDPTTLALTQDKHLCKALCAAEGVRTAPWQLLRAEADVDQHNYDFPMIVKLNWEGSGMGMDETCMVQGRDQLREKVAEMVEKYQQPVIAEKLLTGRELTLGLLGNEPKVLPPVEIVVASEEKADCLKPAAADNFQRHCPAAVSPELEGELREIALRVMKLTGCRDCARVDFRLDASGRPNVLEVNALPGLRPDQSFPLAAKAAGFTYTEMIEMILNAALRRYGMLNSAIKRGGGAK